MLSCANKSLVYAPISRLRRSFAGIRKMPTSKAIKKETCKQACSLFFYRLDWRFIHCFREYYSMIVATRPDPTVRPPSRYQTGVLRCANGDFSCDLCGKIRIFRCIRVVFGDFVIMVLSHYFNYSMTVLFFLTLFSQVYFYNIYPLNFPLYLVSFLPTKHHFL